MKARFQGLTINAYKSRIEQAQKNSLQYTTCQYFCPVDATEEERRIHQYFDQNKVQMVDVKSMI